MSENNQTISTAILLFAECRTRLIRSLCVLMFVFAVLSYFANDLYSWLAQPLLRYLPSRHLIATQIVAPFFVPFKLAFLLAFLVSFPYILFHIWSFISPALYARERKRVWPFLFASGMLFYMGLLFCYYIIFPMLFRFLSKMAPEGVLMTPDMSEYLDFTLKLLLVFGFLFEIPIIMVLLIALNIAKRAQFIEYRSYAIVGAFILGMLLAPPDVLSQTLLALPIYFLYEAGILLSSFVVKRTDEKEI